MKPIEKTMCGILSTGLACLALHAVCLPHFAKAKMDVVGIPDPVVPPATAPEKPESKDENPWSKPSNGLRCRLGPVVQEAKPWNGNFRDLPAVSVTYELRNIGGKPIKFLPWFTPMENPVLSNAFHVTDEEGHEAGYIGILVSRLPPTKDRFMTIEAGQTVTNRVELPYDFSKPGTYRISAPLSQPSPGNLRFYYGDDSPDIARNPDHVWIGTLESNEITVEIVPAQK